MNDLTRKEFDRRYAAFSRTTLWPSVLFIVVSMTAAVWWDKSEPGDQSYIFLGGFVVAGLLAIGYLETNVAKKFGLGCPHCGKSMTRFRRFQKFIDQGLCPRCKKSVFLADSGE